MKFIKKLSDSRKGLAFLSVLFAVLFSLIMGALGTVVVGEFPEETIDSAKIFFLWFCASFVVASILLLITDLPEEFAFIYGPALYYGTIFSASFIDDLWHVGGNGDYILAFIIVALLCYISWLKHKAKE